MPNTLVHKPLATAAQHRLASRHSWLVSILRYGARWSRLGYSLIAEGFSGKNTDLIYRNEPISETMLGRLIDRIVLCLPPCQAICESMSYRLTVLESYLRENPDAHLTLISAPCGYSRDLETIVSRLSFEQRSRLTIVGIDLEPRCIEHSKQSLAKASGASCTFVLGSAFEIDSHIAKETEADIVLSIGIADFLSDSELCELYRLLGRRLKPGGILISSTQDPMPLMQRVATGLGILGKSGRFRKKEEFQALVEQTGLSLSASWSDKTESITISTFLKSAATT